MQEYPQEDFLFKGILDGRKAFIGPETVQFDITNKCNNNCICCWNRSPLLGKLSVEKEMAKLDELPFEVIKRTMDDLREMQTKNLFLAGGGEPFMHPDIMKVLRYAKECGMRIFMNSNFTMVNKDMAKEIVELKIDLIHVSLLAGSPGVYALIHPNKAEEEFYKIREMLMLIAKLKLEKGQHLYNPLPHINLYFVIFNLNYHDIPKMIDLAIDTKADSVELTPVDIIPGKTNSLLLTGEQVGRVTKDTERQLKRIDKYNQHEPVKFHIEQVENFLKRINAEEAHSGKYESETVTKQPCYVGWAFSRIKANGEVSPCLKATRISLGNIHQDSFRDIWNGEQAQLFREKAFKLDENDPYFQNIGDDPNCSFGCLKSCDNLHINMELNNKYKDLLKSNGRIR